MNLSQSSVVEANTGIIVGVIVFGILILLIVKGLGSISRNKNAYLKVGASLPDQSSASSDERWHEMGKSARKKSGFGKLMLILLIIVIVWLIFFSENSNFFNEILRNLKK